MIVAYRSRYTLLKIHSVIRFSVTTQIFHILELANEFNAEFFQTTCHAFKSTIITKTY